MNLNSKKLRLINLILNTEKSSVLRKLEEVFETELNHYIGGNSSISTTEVDETSEGQVKVHRVS